jgi:hypothetical protein
MEIHGAFRRRDVGDDLESKELSFEFVGEELVDAVVGESPVVQHCALIILSNQKEPKSISAT